MQKVYLTKHIYRNFSEKERGCWAEMEIEIPFVPFIGLGLVTHPYIGNKEEVIRVFWDINTKRLHCRVKDDAPDLYDGLVSYEDIKQSSQEGGWVLKKDFEVGTYD